MRTRDLPHRTSALPDYVRRRLTPAILNVRAADDRAIAAALSYGQVMVFASVYRALLDWSDFADSSDLHVGVGYYATSPGDDEDGGGDEGEETGEDDGTGEGEMPQLGGIDEAEVVGGGGSGELPPELPIEGLVEIVDAFRAEKAEKAAAAERAHEEDLARRRIVTALAAQLGADLSNVDPNDADQASADFYRDVLNAIADKAGYKEDLILAFELYRRAAHTCPERVKGTEERSRADLIFEATLRIAAVEQVILDEAVTLVVDQLPRYAVAQTEGRLVTFAERSLRVPRHIAQVNMSRRLARVSAIAREAWARVMTDQVMVVAFPSETVRIGRDIPHRDWRKPFYATDLEQLSANAQAIFDQFDRSLGDGRGAGAGDWRRYDDRMNFVANLMRSRQQDASLFWAPFVEEDVDLVWNNAYPKRLGDPFEQAVRTPTLVDYDTVSCDEIAVGRGAFDPQGAAYGETTA